MWKGIISWLGHRYRNIKESLSEKSKIAGGKQ